MKAPPFSALVMPGALPWLPASASPVRPSVHPSIRPPAVLLAEEVLCQLLLPACTPSLVGCPPATLTPSIHLDPKVLASPAQQGSQRLLPSVLRPSSNNCVCVHMCTRVYVYTCVCVWQVLSIRK